MRKILLCGLLVLAALCAGCSDDDDPVTPPAEDYPFAGSAGQLMVNFVKAYEERNYDEYVELLDEGFLFYLLPVTVTDYDLPRDHFIRQEEMGIAEAMFSGTSPGDGVGAVTDLDFLVLAGVEDIWEAADDARFPDTIMRSFDVVLQVEQTAGDDVKQIVVAGRAVFFLSAEQVEYQGGTRFLYRLAGIDDQTSGGGKAVEETPWGSVKALYQPDIVID